MHKDLQYFNRHSIAPRCLWSEECRMPPTPPSASCASRTGRPGDKWLSLVEDVVCGGLFAGITRESGLLRGQSRKVERKPWTVMVSRFSQLSFETTFRIHES